MFGNSNIFKSFCLVEIFSHMKNTENNMGNNCKNMRSIEQFIAQKINDTSNEKVRYRKTVFIFSSLMII